MINITETVLKDIGKKIMPAEAVQYAVQYYLDNNLVAILGDSSVDEKDVADFIKQKSKYGNEIHFKSIKNPGEMVIKDEIIDGVINITGNIDNPETKQSQCFVICAKPEEVKNYVIFDEDSDRIIEQSSVKIKNGDTSEYRLSRVENSDLRFDGGLIDVDAKVNDNIYFDFKSFMPVKVEDSNKAKNKKSRVQALFEFLRGKSDVVKIKSSRSDSCNFGSIDRIFDLLRQECNIRYPRVKQDVKVRKPVNQEKH